MRAFEGPGFGLVLEGMGGWGEREMGRELLLEQKAWASLFHPLTPSPLLPLEPPTQNPYTQEANPCA